MPWKWRIFGNCQVVSDCGLITILTQLNRQNRQSFMRFIKVQKNGFQVQECLCSSNDSMQLSHFKGHFPKAKS